MSDLISRQKAIDALCAVCGNDCDKSEFVYNAPQDEQVILCSEHYVLSTLPSVQTEQQWIPCSERLPGKYVEVLVSVNYKYKGEPEERYADIGSLTEKGWAFVWDVYHRLNEFNEVVAWMPLPDAYEAEK